MPSPEESKILDAFMKDNHDEIIQTIKKNPQLVNMINTKNSFSYSLMFMLIHFKKPLDIIQFIVTHPDFNFQFRNTFVNKHSYTNIEEIFLYGRKDVLAMIIDKPAILKIGEELTYTHAKKILESEESKLAEKQRNTPNLSTNKEDKERVDKMKEMLSMICEATIIHAIANDDSKSLDQLEKEGVNLRDNLSIGRCPNHLVTKKNIKLQEWFPQYFKRHPIDLEASTRSIYEFFKREIQLDKRLEESTQEYYKSLANIHDESYQRRLARMDATINEITKKM